MLPILITKRGLTLRVKHCIIAYVNSWIQLLTNAFSTSHLNLSYLLWKCFAFILQMSIDFFLLKNITSFYKINISKHDSPKNIGIHFVSFTCLKVDKIIKHNYLM